MRPGNRGVFERKLTMASRHRKNKHPRPVRTSPLRDALRLSPGIPLGAAALAAMILAVYFPALTGEPLWDDAVWAEEPLVLNWSGIREIWLEPSAIRQEGHYWPFVYTSFWLEHKFWGLSPLGYHLVNVLLHLANTLLAWRLLAVLRVPGAWAAAAIFAVHPLHVESVAWIVERKDLLSTLFYFCAALAWVRPGGPRIALTAALLVAALLSKSMPVTFPAALLIWYWWRREWPSLREAAGLALLFAVSLSITLADLSFYASREPLSLGYSFVERVQIASHALWFYAGKLVWPSNLAVIYPHWEIGAANVAAWLYVIAAVAAAALLWFGRHRIGRAPAAAAGFFALTLAPSLGFIDYGYMQFSFAADRFQYLAGLGLIALASAAGAHLAVRHELLKKAAPVALAATLAAFGAVAWNQSGIYRNGIVFFEHVISHNPTARDAHVNLGAEYMNAGRHADGLEATLIAVEQRSEYAGAHLNLGLAYMRLDRLQESRRAVMRALELDPEYRDGRQNLGEVLRRQGEYQAAEAQYREALRIDPEYASAHAGLAQSLFQLGRYAEAVDAIDRALELGVETFAAQTLNLVAAQALGKLGRFDEAERRIAQTAAEAPGDVRPAATRVALRIESGETAASGRLLREALESFGESADDLYALGESLATLDAREQALRAYRAALSVDPEHVRALVGAANLEHEFGSYAQSFPAFEQALVLLPELADQSALHRSMGEAAMELGQNDAADYFERALAVDPGDYASMDRLAMLRFNAERYEDAMALYETMLKLRPRSHAVHTNLGITLYRMRRIAEAREYLEQALAIEPGYELALSMLAEIEREQTEPPGN